MINPEEKYFTSGRPLIVELEISVLIEKYPEYFRIFQQTLAVSNAQTQAWG